MSKPLRELHNYQWEALEFLSSRPHSGLFMDMGLGKTGTMLNVILDLKAVRDAPKPVLVVGPIRVVESVWEQESKLWMGTETLRFSLLRGTKTQRERAAKIEADVYLVNPELLEEALTLRNDFQTLIIDESSQFKDSSTARFKTLRKHLARFKRRHILTGTPNPNSLLDLWAQVFILDRGERLGTSFGKFKSTYFYPTDYQGYKFAPFDWAEAAITEKISDIILVVSARGKLPPRTVINNPIRFKLPEDAAKVYKSLEKHALAYLQGGEEGEVITAPMAVTKLMKLRQVASGFVYDEDGKAHQVHSEKIKFLKEILDQTPSPVIVLYQFVHELEALRKAFPQGVVFDSDQVEPWNQGKIPLLFLHPQSGGHGVNLQYGGHTMVVFSASFSLEQMSQAMARIDRQGQAAPVTFHYLVALETVDELLLEVLHEKAGSQDRVLRLIKEYADARRPKN